MFAVKAAEIESFWVVFHGGGLWLKILEIAFIYFALKLFRIMYINIHT